MLTNEINMDFNYKPVVYGEIKSGKGKPINPNTNLFKWLKKATPEDKRIADIYLRYGEKERCFSANIAWDENVLQTITARFDCSRPTEFTTISIEDIIHAQTFPEDYDFGEKSWQNVSYFCGMSVPPIMIKRIVTKLIEQGVYEYVK